MPGAADREVGYGEAFPFLEGRAMDDEQRRWNRLCWIGLIVSTILFFVVLFYVWQARRFFNADSIDLPQPP